MLKNKRVKKGAATEKLVEDYLELKESFHAELEELLEDPRFRDFWDLRDRTITAFGRAKEAVRKGKTSVGPFRVSRFPTFTPKSAKLLGYVSGRRSAVLENCGIQTADDFLDLASVQLQVKWKDLSEELMSKADDNDHPWTDDDDHGVNHLKNHFSDIGEQCRVTAPKPE